jgi:AraC-like DNA-binding protein
MDKIIFGRKLHMPRQKQNLTSFFGRNVTHLPLFPLAGVIWTNQPMPMLPHYNPGFEITHLLSGHATWTVKGGSDLRLSADQMGIMQPDAFHGAEDGMMQPCRLFWFVVNPDAGRVERNNPFSADELKAFAATLRKAGSRTLPTPPEMMALHQRLARLAIQAQNSGGWRNCPALVRHLRLELCKALLLATDAIDMPKAETAPQILDAAIAFMSNRLGTPPSVPEIAAAAGTSVATLHRVFRMHVSQTPAEYCHHLRLKQACEWLETGSLTVVEIARRLGFSSSQYFANCFRRAYGKTPGEHRLDPTRKTMVLPEPDDVDETSAVVRKTSAARAPRK